jgi:gamma-glutamylaminecyclotransferase
MPYYFAHGDLRKGGRSQAIMADATLIGGAETEEAFALFMVDKKAVVTRRPATKIKGDVYSVTDEKLAMLDRFEAHPRITKREEVLVRLDDGKMVDAWVYFNIQPLHNSVLLESGDFMTQQA